MEAGGRTIAVLGNGLCHVYPPEHAELCQRIAASGAVLSELPMQTAPDALNFPPRNRIIAGLALGVIVVEGSKRSGALITARLANEYNREVFALPGRIDAIGAEGPNGLIRDQAAKLVTCLEDVLDELGEAGRTLRAQTSSAPDESPCPLPAGRSIRLDENEQRVLNALGQREQSIDQICESTGLAASCVASSVTTLQLKGMVKQLTGGLFVRARHTP